MALNLDQPDYFGQSVNAFNMGRQIGRQKAVQNALAGYAKDPAGTQNALIGLGAMDEAKQVGGFTQEANRKAYGQKAASGDLAGASKDALAAGDFDVNAELSKMDTVQQQKAIKALATTVQIGEKLKQLYPTDPNNPDAAIQARRKALESLAPDLSQQLGVPPEAVMGADVSDNGIDLHTAAYRSINPQKLQTVNRGDGAYDVVDETTGGIVRSVDRFAPDAKTTTIRDAAGNEALYAIDPRTGQPMGGGAGGDSAQGSLAQRNNNPGNLRPDGSNWQGMTGEAGGFVQFDTPENGMRAARINLANQAKLHGINTINDLIAKWAPASDNNDPQTYAQTVSRLTGLDPNAPLDFTDPQVQDKILPAIAQVEGGGTPSPQARNGAQPTIAAPGFGSGVDPKQQRLDMQQQKQDQQIQVTQRKEFDALQDVKNYNVVATSYNAIKKAAAGKTAADDIALIYNFMRINDPNSVVREGEFATAQNAAGVPDRVRNAYNKALQGTRLNDTQRDQFVNTAKSLHTAQRERYDEIVDQYRGYVKDQGFDPDRTFKTRANPDAPAPAPKGLRPAAQDSTPEQHAKFKAVFKPGAAYGSKGAPLMVHNDRDYNALKSGQYFIDPKGVVRIKP